MRVLGAARAGGGCVLAKVALGRGLAVVLSACGEGGRDEPAIGAFRVVLPERARSTGGQQGGLGELV